MTTTALKSTLATFIMICLGFVLLARITERGSDAQTEDAAVWQSPWHILQGFHEETLYLYVVRGRDCGTIIKGLAAVPDGNNSYIPYYVSSEERWGAKKSMRAEKFRTIEAAKAAVEESCRMYTRSSTP